MSKLGHPTLIVHWSPGSVEAVEATTFTRKKADTIQAAVNGSDSSRTLVALSRTCSLVRSMRVPDASKSDIELILRNRLNQVFPAVGADLEFDFQITNDRNSEGRLVLVGAARSEILKQLMAQLAEAGITPEGIVPASIGAQYALAKSGLKDAAFVERASGGLGIDLVADGVLRYSRIAPEDETAPIQVARTFAAAEIAERPTVRSGEVSIESDYSSTIGAVEALSGIDLAHLPLNIELREQRLKKEAQARARTTRVAIAALVGSLLVAALVGNDYYSASQKVAVEVQAQQAKLDSFNQHKKKSEDAAGKVSPGANALNVAFQPAQTTGDILTLVANDTPTGVWLTGITLERGKPMDIRGSAIDSVAVSKYMQQLSSEGRFRAVTLVFSSNATVNNQPIVQFSLTAFPVGNLPLVDKSAKTAKGGGA